MAKQKPWKTTARVWDAQAKAYVTVKLAVAIDWDAIALDLARRAIRNRSGRSAMLAGAVVGKITERLEPTP